MKFLCISPSNVKHKKDDSTSTKTCKVIEKIIKSRKKKIEAETIVLW